jgi:pimeloyl-ACP methyl ester carboxylesterase
MVARIVLLAFTALVLAGCAQKNAIVSERSPVFHPASTGTATIVSAQKSIADASRQEQREPLAALGTYLKATQDAARELRRNPRDMAARDTYNFALGRLLETIKEAKLDPWMKPLRVPAAGGEFTLTHKPDPRPQWNPALYEFTPADEFDIKGSYVTEHNRKDGIGAPLVAKGLTNNANSRENFYLPRTYYGVTAVARFEGRRCVIAFEDPLATETTTLDGHVFPLAADFTVPLAVLLAETDYHKLELARMLNPQKYAGTALIARLQPYDPNKTVVLVIHGLQDSAATWAPMINALRGDERIRRHYQFWFYSYPSGYPYPYSASILRQQLDAAERKFPLRKRTVVIGHSMGGCITRLLITDTGNKIWMDIFGKPPAQVPLSPETKKLYTDALIFRHRPEIGRVIFISSPLRGADMASNWIGRIGSSLVKAPGKLLTAGNEVRQFETLQPGELKLKRIPNSVDTLAPNDPFVVEINKIPITPGIPYHVISGDRGKGGNKDHTKPVMSDGVVPYWSSHLDGAVSELVVPSEHGAHHNPQAIAEVKRILKKYAK